VRLLQFRTVASVLLSLTAPALMGSTTVEAGFYGQILAAHNRERDAMGAPALVWDSQLAEGAQEWAGYLAKTGRFAHSPDEPGAEPVGENIWGGTAAHYGPDAMVNLWIAEKRYFRAGTFPANSTTGDVHDVSHYTQLVWKTSRKVGCGISRGAREDILVCRYSAAGNVIGQRPL
jgi:hypothetical protein